MAEIKKPLDLERKNGLVFMPSVPRRTFESELNGLELVLIQASRILLTPGLKYNPSLDQNRGADRLMLDRWWFSFARFIKKEAKVAAQIGPYRELTGSQCET